MHKKVGILGGTFDPIHNGHLEIANCALKQLPLDEIQFIPCNLPAHRATPLASSKDRLAMVKLATENNPKFTVNALELERPGPSYTIETVKALKKPNQKLYFIIGADGYVSFKKWYHWQEIPNYCELVVYNRPGYDISAIHHPEISDQVTILNMPPCDISASKIRQLIQEKTYVANALPKEVYQYISDKKLYLK